jgi:hypothetical protein
MIQKMAAAAAMICASAASAAADTTITPGFYETGLYVVSSNDPNKACFDIGFEPGYYAQGVAEVRGAGKPLYISEVFYTTPPANSSALPSVVFVDYIFHNIPQAISDPVTYDGPARGSSPTTNGVSLRWTGGTLNTIATNQFKLTASNISVTKDKKLLCTMSIDTVFLATGY